MKLKSLLALAGFVLSAAFAPFASAQQLGTDYSVLTPPQPTEAPGKIEVTEFFWYGCPHCHDFDPLLRTWVKSLPKDVSFRRVPAALRPQWIPGAKIYYTLEAMNLLDKLHAELFDAIHNDRLNYTDDKALGEWLSKKGVDAAKFFEVEKSFSVQSKVQRADQIVRAHNIQGVPTLVIDGKYMIASTDHETQLKIADALIAKVRAEGKKK